MDMGRTVTHNTHNVAGPVARCGIPRVTHNNTTRACRRVLLWVDASVVADGTIRYLPTQALAVLDTSD